MASGDLVSLCGTSQPGKERDGAYQEISGERRPPIREENNTLELIPTHKDWLE